MPRVGENLRPYKIIASQLGLRIGKQARSAYLQFSQVWFPTVQDVLQADWQDVWHSPHPPFLIVFCNFLVFNVFTCFIKNLSFSSSIDGTLKSAYLLYYITALPIWKGLFEKSSRSDHSSDHRRCKTKDHCNKHLHHILHLASAYCK